jgi:hypothetical protein
VYENSHSKSNGRCYCENPSSKSCKRISNDYDRYDFNPHPANQVDFKKINNAKPFKAKFVRFIVQSWNDHISMRAGLVIGREAKFGAGDFDISRMTKAGMPDNKVSSIKVLDAPTWMDSSDVNKEGILPLSGDWDEDKFQVVLINRVGAFGDPCHLTKKHVLINYVCKPSVASMSLLNAELVSTAVATLPPGATSTLAASKDWTFETWIKLEKDWRKKDE